MNTTIAIAGNEFGVIQSYNLLPKELIKCVIAPVIRPHLHDPLRNFAKKRGLDFLIQEKFESTNYSSFIETFRSLEIDLLVTNNYSMIVRPDLLSMLNRNAINVHWALLPKNRGCNPVNWQIIKGEEKAGITLHFIDEGLDSGDIIAQQEVPIFFNDTWVDLKNRLAHASEEFLKVALGRFLESKFERIPQALNQVTFNNRLYPESPKIDFERMSDLEVYNLIRGQVSPLRGAFVEKNGERIYFDQFVPFDRIVELRKIYS